MTLYCAAPNPLKLPYVPRIALFPIYRTRRKYRSISNLPLPFLTRVNLISWMKRPILSYMYSILDPEKTPGSVQKGAMYTECVVNEHVKKNKLPHVSDVSKPPSDNIHLLNINPQRKRQGVQKYPLFLAAMGLFLKEPICTPEYQNVRKVVRMQKNVVRS